MNRERLVAIAAIVLVAGGFVFLRNRNRVSLGEGEINGNGSAIEERASEFAREMGVVLPDDVDKITLNDVSGGSGTGLATRKFVGNTFTHSVLASLSDPEKGSWYEGWIVRPDPFDVVYTGKLRVAKGGWVLDFVSGEDLTDHTQVVVTLEKVDDQKPEKHILEGNF